MAREWDRVDRKRSRSRSPNRSSKSSRSDRHHKHSDRDRKRSRHSSHHRSRSVSHSPSPPRLSKRLDSTQPALPRGSTPERINQEKVEDIIGGDVNYRNFDMDEQQKRLELIMQQRRERVEKWRKQQKVEEKVTVSNSDATSTESSNFNVISEPQQQPSQQQIQPEQPKKAWTFDDDNYYEDDDDEDDQVPMQEDDEQEDTFKVPPPSRTTKDDNVEEDKIDEVVKEKSLSKVEPVIESLNLNTESDKSNEKTENDLKLDEIKVEEKVKQTATPAAAELVKEPEEEEDDVDPLDAYMQGIQEEVKKYRSHTIQANKGNNKVTMVVGVAKKKTGHKRGELMEQNQDALEFSSGDEGVGKEDELANAMDNLQAKAKQKKLLTISKDDITFLPFRKNFYIEVPEITRMTHEEVDAYKIIMEGIKTKGKGCPRPIKTWAQCGVSKRVFDVLKKNNYEKPTPIQCQAIPAIMSGRDLIGIAKTGSGKTLAFLLPMFRHIMDQAPLEPGDGPIAVIMTPTRELATQIYAESRKFAKSLGLRVVAVYGGTPISEQIGDLKPGAEVVVCTPGRMIDMLAANSGRVTNLRRCTYVVLDEADRMFDMGFEPQVMRIIDGIRPDRQTVMFSATFPRIMEALARRILDKPIEVQVGGRSIVCKEVEQQIVIVNEDDKFLKLLEILGKYSTQGSAIAFVDKQEHADMLLKELMHASYTCLALHGGIDQNDRDSTIADFKNGKVNVLVATSVAARGLDVKHCIVVINYDCPNHYEDYVHRCGRTGRAGNKGFAYTFITPEQGRYANDLIKALDLSGNKVPEELQQLFDEFKKEQESMGKKVKSSSGFTGKGFKFDEAEAQQAVEKKKIQKAALGLQDSDDEDPEADIDQEIENMLAPKKKTISAQQPIIPVSSAPGTSAPAATLSTFSTAPVAGEKSLTEKLELAKQLASRISMSKTPSSHNMNNVSSATAQTEAILKGDTYSLGNIASAVNAKSIAEQRAEKLHAKLNYIPKDLEYNENGDIVRREEEGEQFSTQVASSSGNRFEEELEINDFPQQARWRVTSKEAIAMISEYSEAGITVRGTFFPPGKEPKELGERKLYLAIEGTNDISVGKARAEIIRLIKEELVKLSNSYLPFNKNRYKVL